MTRIPFGPVRTDDTTHLAGWRAWLGRALFALRWKLFGRGQSNYRCLSCRIPVSSDTADDSQDVPLRHPLRRRS